MKLLEAIYFQIYSETEIAKRLQRAASNKVTELNKQYENGTLGDAKMEDVFADAVFTGLKCGFQTGVRFVADLLLKIFKSGEENDGF
ncbi:MAG: hypothetical protein LUE90_00310 [Clostridiales bacterium]|nr:hypothetical protein [Clostridiales bacterium]